MPPMNKKDEKKEKKDAKKDANGKGKAKGNGNEEQDSGAFAGKHRRTRSADKTDGEFSLLLNLFTESFKSVYLLKFIVSEGGRA